MIDRSVMGKVISSPARWTLAMAGAIAAAIGLKVGVLAFQAVPFNADEAIVALMARHILQGELPLFFYGQAYMGSLDAFLVAGLFKLFGPEIWCIRLVQIVLYAGTLATTGWLGKKLTGKWRVGAVATWLLAVPTVSMTLYTTVSIGDYGEMLLLGNLILLLTVSIARDNPARSQSIRLKWFGLGFLSGFGLWVFGLTLVYSLPAVIFLAWRTKSLVHEKPISNPQPSVEVVQGGSAGRGLPSQVKTWGVLITGAILGSAPWLWYGFQNGWAESVSELGGGAIAGVEFLSWGGQLFQHALNLGLFGTTVLLGLRPSWEIRWLGLPLAPLVLAFWGGVLLFAVKKTIKELRTGWLTNGYTFAPLLSGVIVTLLLGFLLSPFGADPSGRYFLPVSVIMALFAGQAVWVWEKSWSNIAPMAVGVVLLFNLWGTVQAVRDTPPGITTQFDAVTQIDHAYDQQLIAFLEEQGEGFGYTNYWVAYPLAFHSGENLVYVPHLPYHQDLRYTSRDDRYDPYSIEVEGASQAAYITTKNPPLDERIRTGFENLGLEWREASIGDYRVYYQISNKVEPAQIGLGGEEG